MSGDRSNNDIFGGSGSDAGTRAKMTGMPVRNTMKDDFGLDIPTELVPLPSCGKVYPETSSLHGKEAIEIRPMTAREEDILTSRALIKKGTVITELIKSCLIDKSINPDDLISGDRNAIMTSLRITGYGNDYNIEVQCPSCSEKSKQTFNLSELPIKRLEVEPETYGSNIFSYELPYTKKKIKFKFLDGNDETNINKLQERSKKSGNKTSNMITLRYRHQILAVDEITDKTKIQMFIRNMPARDSRSLRAHIDSVEPGIDMKAWIECPMCAEQSEVRMPLGASFFWPDAE
jgi:hypothetical protein|tara:strand:+ start:34808 stop:35677 length:870 start_codon:yes stop_codon:yes gene_type:complete